MSPITRETLAARIATLEAEKDISIKEAFYLKTMRLLLAEMDKPQPHHNGMMQLSNELADLKRRHAELEEVIQQRNGECSWRQRESYDLAVIVKSLIFNLRKTGAGESAIFTAEDFLKRHGLQDAVLSFSSSPSGELSGNTEQLDTAPAQFESLAGEHVSEPYKLPIKMTPEMMRAVQVNSELGAYAAANLSGAYDLFAEFWEVACRATGNYPETPEGYALVPIEPTEAMMLHKSECGHHAWNDQDCPMRKTRRLVWAYMIEAAQEDKS